MRNLGMEDHEIPKVDELFQMKDKSIILAHLLSIIKHANQFSIGKLNLYSFNAELTNSMD